MIQNMQLTKFSSFEDLSVDFSSGINVIIGENGTGKTQLLKAAYAIASSSYMSTDTDAKDIETFFTERMTNIFLPEELKIGRLSRCQESKCTSIKADFLEDYSHDKSIKFDFSTRVQSLKLDHKTDGELYKMEPIFIPTKEVLSLYRGLVHNPGHIDYFKSIFDESYFDLCAQLQRAPSESQEVRLQSFLEEIVNKIQGRFEFNETSINFNSGIYQPYADPKKDGTYFNPTPDINLSTHMIAEGFRKLGVLHRLIDNSTLVPKKSGTLFWDEPESNINPKLMKLIVEVLIELAKKEQQVILTTHDYVLLKWFHLLSDENTHINYHVLSRDPENNAIIHSKTDDYLDIFPNPIDDAFSFLIDQEIVNDMGI